MVGPSVSKATMQGHLFKTLYSSIAAVLTYKISKKDVGIIINKAVAVKPKMFTSIIKDIRICF